MQAMASRTIGFRDEAAQLKSKNCLEYFIFVFRESSRNFIFIVLVLQLP
jgi:hypothetical protein